MIQVDVPQNTVALFSVDDKARIKLEGRPAAEARIRFINRQANESTRTFAIELALPNPNMRMPAGLSVEAELMIDQVSAIKISPAFLSLSDQGELGVKWLDTENQVHFTLAQIVKTESNSFWLSGIPEHARIITRGHGFVNPGDRVLVAPEGDKLLAGE